VVQPCLAAGNISYDGAANFLTKEISAMRRLAIGLCAVVAVTATVHAQETVKKPARVTTSVVRTGAIVEAVDRETREIKLLGADGKRFSIVADDSIKNFDQIDPRDRIMVEYLQSVAIIVGPPGTEPTTADLSAIAVAEPGEKPRVGIADTRAVVGTVTSLDTTHRLATLSMPTGESVTVKVHDDVPLELVKVGDPVATVVTSAVAITVEEPPTRE
jgi:hypothetical protein